MEPSSPDDPTEPRSPQELFEGSGPTSGDGSAVDSATGREAATTATGRRAVALSFDDVLKRYESGEQTVTALDHVNLRIETGEFVTVMGPSGSGKSTMLNLLGLLDEPTEGTVRIDGEETADLTDDERTQLRKDRLGFVFQDFYLLPTLTAVENVTLPTIFGDGEPARDRAAELLERVGLGDRLEHDPSELSGGQQQRVAIARSLINQPRIVLADEPTGNLDRTTSRQVLDVLSDVSGGSVSVVAVTHDDLVTEYTDRTVQLVDGRIDSNGRESDSNSRDEIRSDTDSGPPKDPTTEGN